MSESFFSRLDKLDSIITAGPSVCDYDRDLAPYLADDAINSYFYASLQDSSWLPLLEAAGEFSLPPRAQFRSSIQPPDFPVWPASKYLVRMAPLAPDTVLHIALSLPPSDNIRIHEDIVELACGLPVALASQIVPLASDWIRDPYKILLPEHLRRLLTHLIKGEAIGPALNLARATLSLMPGEQPDVSPTIQGDMGDGGATRLQRSLDNLLSGGPPPARSWIDVWYYEEILKIVTTDLQAADAPQVFALLCDVLQEAVEARVTDRDKRPDDGSHVWRTLIEEGKGDFAEGVEDLLVSAVRDTSEYVIEHGLVHLSTLVNVLDARRWRIFERLALYLLNRFPERAPNALAPRLENRETATALDLWHEYSLLLRDCFGRLSSIEQARVFAMIDQGPLIATTSSDDVTNPSTKRRREIWQRDRLTLISSYLPPQWQARLNTLIEIYGAPNHPEYLYYVPAMDMEYVQPSVAKEWSVDDVARMSVHQVLDLLLDRRDDGRALTGDGKTVSGSTLVFDVGRRPVAYARSARQFQDCTPAYIQALIHGIRESIMRPMNVGKGFPWLPVLALLDWVVTHPHETTQPDDNVDADRMSMWKMTCREAAALLSDAFEKGSAELPVRLRRKAWGILVPLTDNADPTPNNETPLMGPHEDAYTFAINTVRGEAIQAVVKYGLWLRRHLTARQNKIQRPSRGFGDMPEVRDVLDHHLHPEVDPSREVRAMYGRHFPWLVLLDAQWAEQNVDRIFPRGDSMQPLRDAAWETYINYCTPYTNVVRLLYGEYNLAVGRIGESDQTKKRGPHRINPTNRLAEHITMLYWRGQADLNGPNDLVRALWTQASQDVRVHIMTFIGRNLKGTDVVPKEIIERLASLWLWRFEAAVRSSDLHNYAAELAHFGWWFLSGKFDERWAVTQILSVLRLVHTIDPEVFVVGRLGDLASEMPAEAIECLDLIIRTPDGTGRFWYGGGEVRTVLEKVLRGDDQGAKLQAESVLHYLGSLLFLSVRDLLPFRVASSS